MEERKYFEEKDDLWKKAHSLIDRVEAKNIDEKEAIQEGFITLQSFLSTYDKKEDIKEIISFFESYGDMLLVYDYLTSGSKASKIWGKVDTLMFEEDFRKKIGEIKKDIRSFLERK